MSTREEGMRARIGKIGSVVGALLVACVATSPSGASAQAFDYTYGYQDGYAAGKQDAGAYCYTPPPVEGATGFSASYLQGLKEGYDMGYAVYGGSVEQGGIPYSGANATTDGYEDGLADGSADKEFGAPSAPVCPAPACAASSPYCSSYVQGYGFGYVNGLSH
jgi:hypothetical protein